MLWSYGIRAISWKILEIAKLTLNRYYQWFGSIYLFGMTQIHPLKWCDFGGGGAMDHLEMISYQGYTGACDGRAQVALGYISPVVSRRHREPNPELWRERQLC